MTAPAISSGNGAFNPYVGPRTFTRAEGKLFFGREREAEDLLARIMSERLLLFYTQSGAGKSSLINARLIPKLQEEGFAVLPVARISGELPPGVDEVDNIYLFNLMVSIDRGETSTASLSRLSLEDFFAHLVTQDGEHWCYDPSATPPEQASGPPTVTQPYVLIIDQFEEIITSHPDRWQERRAFFVELNRAMGADPNLWVVLALRDDYVAALDPFTKLMADRLRGRYHMAPMDVQAALEAVRRPAQFGGRPFAEGVAERLVDDVSQVRVPGQQETTAGQYIEPVQLQVVCYQLWERINRNRSAENWAEPIAEQDLKEAGDVNQALTAFYEETLTSVLGAPGVAEASVNERALRQWFERELITETGIRSTVFRNDATRRTGSLPNVAVEALSRRFLVRTELRGAGRVGGARPRPVRGAGACEQRSLVDAAPESPAAAGGALGRPGTTGRSPLARGGPGTSRGVGGRARGRARTA